MATAEAFWVKENEFNIFPKKNPTSPVVLLSVFAVTRTALPTVGEGVNERLVVSQVPYSMSSLRSFIFLPAAVCNPAKYLAVSTISPRVRFMTAEADIAAASAAACNWVRTSTMYPMSMAKAIMPSMRIMKKAAKTTMAARRDRLLCRLSLFLIEKSASRMNYLLVLENLGFKLIRVKPRKRRKAESFLQVRAIRLRHAPA